MLQPFAAEDSVRYNDVRLPRVLSTTELVRQAMIPPLKNSNPAPCILRSLAL